MTTDNAPKLQIIDEIRLYMKATFLSREPASLPPDYSEDIGNRIGWGIYAAIVFDEKWPVTVRTRVMMPETTTDYSVDVQPQKIGKLFSARLLWPRAERAAEYIALVEYTETARLAYNQRFNLLWTQDVYSKLEDETIEIVPEPLAPRTKVQVLARTGDLVIHRAVSNDLEPYTISHAPTGRKVVDVRDLASGIGLMTEFAERFVNTHLRLDAISFRDWFESTVRIIRKGIEENRK